MAAARAGQTRGRGGDTVPESERKHETPLGFGMALAEDPRAMAYYAGLNPEERETVIDQARCIRSKELMRQFVHDLGRREG